MSVNRVTLLGNIGADPDYKKLDNGNEVASMRMATTEKGYKMRDGREVPEKTEWHDVVIWGGMASIAQKYLHKGSKVYIEGMLRHREYTDKTGVKRYVTEVHADVMEILDSKQGAQQAQSTPATEVPPMPAQTQVEKKDEELPF